jgi:hypothetical protein
MYQQQQGAVDQANKSSLHQLEAEIQQNSVELAEKTRVDAILDPGAGPQIHHQTRSPEEFRQRRAEQAADPEYAARTVLKMDETDELSELRKMIDAGHSSLRDRAYVETVDAIRGSQKRHKTMVDKMLAGFNKNPRFASRAKAWHRGSPYENDLVFHTDRISDPTRPKSFIQYEDPREIGIHGGYNAAAEGVISRGGIEAVIEDATSQAKAIADLAESIDAPVAEIESLFAQAGEAHFRKVFSGGKGASAEEIWGEVQMLVEDYVELIGAPTNESSRFLQGLKDLPTPNTSPLMFRGQNGLLLQDQGAFLLGTVAEQVEEIFPHRATEISAAISNGSTKERTDALVAILEDEGFDHIYYYNSVEDKGSVSIINWNEDLMASPWDAEFTRGNSQEAAKAATAFVMGVLGFGNAELRK